MASRRGDDGLDASFSVAAAHELKAPLALIRQLSLAIEQNTLNAVEVDRLASRITLTSERALRLTTDLTRASRLQSGLFELEPVNPHELCEEVARELRPLFRAHGVDIKVKGKQRNLLAVANRDLLRRVLVNFSDNALKYAGDFNIVELTAQTRGSVIRVGVRDYGPALPGGMWRDLKSSLGKSAQPIHTRPDSSGLGLYLANQFADQMNGSIGAVHHRDGATFYVDVQASTQLSLL